MLQPNGIKLPGSINDTNKNPRLHWTENGLKSFTPNGRTSSDLNHQIVHAFTLSPAGCHTSPNKFITLAPGVCGHLSPTDRTIFTHVLRADVPRLCIRTRARARSKQFQPGCHSRYTINSHRRCAHPQLSCWYSKRIKPARPRVPGDRWSVVNTCALDTAAAVSLACGERVVQSPETPCARAHYLRTQPHSAAVRLVQTMKIYSNLILFPMPDVR